MIGVSFWRPGAAAVCYPRAIAAHSTPAAGPVAHRALRYAAAITAAINQVLAGNPTADLHDIEMTFRAAACASYLVATDSGFRIVIGVQAWIAELDAAG